MRTKLTMFTRMLRSALVMTAVAAAFTLATAGDVSWDSPGGDSGKGVATQAAKGDVSWNVLPGAKGVAS